jgi:hypothetical protein
MKTRILAIVFLAVAWRAIAKRRPGGPRQRLSAQPPSTTSDGVPETSPNAAERLQDSHARGAFAGIASALPLTSGDADLFPKRPSADDAAEGADDIVPGLPDFARGA